MAFALVVGIILVLGLFGRRASRGTYMAVAGAAALASVWEYLHI